MSKGTDIVKKEAVDYAVLASDGESLAEILKENIGGDELTPFDLDRIKIPAGGGTTWEVPSIDGPKDTKILTGIIVHLRMARVYWEGSFGDGEAGPPDCSSDDSFNGVGNPGGNCSVCPMAQWKSARNDGKGQACKLVRLVFLVQPESMIPMVLPLPPTSLRDTKKYLLRLTGARLPFYCVETHFSLEKSKNGAGIEYSKAIPKVGKRLDAEDRTKMKAYVESMKASFDRVKVETDDYNTEPVDEP